MKNLLTLIIDAAKNDDMQRVIDLAEKQQDNFCDNNCVWTDHHPDCKLGTPNRQELQAKGEHPAPCARFCEANAFQIEIRNLKAKLENQHPEWYHTKNIHGCDVFYHKSEERSYMSGEITPLYTTPPQPKEPEQEPVAWMFQHEETGRMMFVEAQQLEWGFEKGNPRLKKIGPVYTTPPQRTWVGLSDDEMWNAYTGGSDIINLDYAKAIEAKLKDLNT